MRRRSARRDLGESDALDESGQGCQDTVWVQQQGGAQFDAFADGYSARIDHPLRRLVDVKGDYFVQLKCSHIEKVARELSSDPAKQVAADIGCGVGSFERTLSRIFEHVFAIDVSAPMLQAAGVLCASPNVSFILADAKAIPLPDASMDLVFSSCLFHHLERTDLFPVLRECRRITRPGGYVLCFEHNPLNPATQLVVRTTPIDRDARLVPDWTVAAAFRQAGLDVIRRRFILFAPEPLDRMLTKLGEWVSKVPWGGQYLVLGRRR